MPEKPFSGAALDALSERLRDGPLTFDDLQQLRRFLETLEPFAEETFARIQLLRPERFADALLITRRTTKTIKSIIAKLRRQSISLRQMQDLIGCRIVVFDAIDQEKCLTDLMTLFSEAKYDDRRDKARYGYRAIHVVPRNGRQRFEIQLRTRFQDEWANVVEKVADRVGIEVKYGGGDARLQQELSEMSSMIQRVEQIEARISVRLEEAPPSDRWMRLHSGEIEIVTTEALPSGTSLMVRFLDEPGEDRAYVCDPSEESETGYEIDVSQIDGSENLAELLRILHTPAGKSDRPSIRTNTPEPGVPHFYFQSIGFEGGLDVYDKYSDLLSEAFGLYTEVGSLMRRIESGLG